MSFTVTVLPSGRTFGIETNETVLAAAIRQNVGLPYGCRDGACSSCKSRLVAGKVVHGAHQVKALSPLEEEQGLVLTCCATAQSDVSIEARTIAGAGEFPVRKMPGRVMSIEKVASDVVVLTLQLPAGQPLQYHAGQYVEFLLPGGDRRSYSMASAPSRQTDRPSVELHIRHMPGGRFTDHVFSNMKEKEIVRIEGPFGSFFLREESAKPIVLLASGTGFAPVKAMLEHIEFKGIARPVALYWGCRSRADLYLDAWVHEATKRIPQLVYVPVLSEPKTEDHWGGRTGFVHLELMKDMADLSGHQVYACGAPIVVESAERDLIRHCHLPADEFFADSFTSEADKH